VNGICFRSLRADEPHTGVASELFHETPVDLEDTVLPVREKRSRRLLAKICRTRRMSTFAIGALIQEGVSRLEPGQAFVNVGVWCGFSLFAGMVGNPGKRCIGIDNFSEFGGPRGEFLSVFDRIRSPSHEFHELDWHDYFKKVHRAPIGFYVYDASHDYKSQLEGLRAAEPFFAENCRILVDDTNWAAPREATLKFLARRKGQYRILLDRRTCANGHPTFWNGIMLLEKVRPRARPRQGRVQ
jgi:hypothetical protein